MNTVCLANIETWAILLGGTDSIVDLRLPYGYELLNMRLSETPLHDEVIKEDGSLDITYIASNLGDDDDPEFIFLRKSEEKEIPIEFFSVPEMTYDNPMANNFLSNISAKHAKEIFYILSFMRLTQEGNIEVACSLHTLKAKLGVNLLNITNKLYTVTPVIIYDDLYQWDECNLNVFNKIATLPKELVQKLDEIMERFGRGYSIDRYDDAFKNLVTLGEIILIGYNATDRNRAKKEKFAKRLTAAIADDINAQTMYENACLMYKERSNEAHEGKNENITKEKLKELRCLIRQLLQDFIFFSKDKYENLIDQSFEEMKKEYILHLLSRVHSLNLD